MPAFPSQRATMEDIAAALGISKMSVSRALRGLSCSKSLREQVEAKAAELGYSPDPLQSLHMARLRRRAGESGTIIAILDMLTPPESPRSAISGSMLGGMAQRARALGMSTEVFSLRPLGLGLGRFRQVLAARNIHGLIIPPLPTAHTTLDFDFSGLSTVTIAYSLESPAIDRVSHDHYQAMLDAMSWFHASGKRRIGLALNEMSDDRIGRRWHAAYYEFCRSHAGMKTAPMWQMGRDLEVRSLGAWIAKHQIEVVIGLAPKLIGAIEEAGYKVPREVDYFDLDTSPSKEGVPHQGIDQRYDELGAAAVDVVVGKWARREYGPPASPKTVLLSGELRLMKTG